MKPIEIRAVNADANRTRHVTTVAKLSSSFNAVPDVAASVARCLFSNEYDGVGEIRAVRDCADDKLDAIEAAV